MSDRLGVPKSVQTGNDVEDNAYRMRKPKPPGSFRTVTTSDEPVYRSVSIVGSLPIISKKEILDKSKLLRTQSTNTTACLTVDGDLSSDFNIPDRSWDVTFSITELPSIPLSCNVRFCITVVADNDYNLPSAIAKRIEKRLKDLSLAPHYCVDRTKVCAYVTNCHHVEYVVNIFRGKPGEYNRVESASPNNSEFITVEVQKRRGHGRSFFEETKSILGSVRDKSDTFIAAESNEDVRVRPAFPESFFKSPPPIPDSFLSKYSDRLRSEGLCAVADPRLSTQISDKSMENVTKMIVDVNDIDQNLYGLEEVKFLTDDKKACARVSSEVLQRLRQGDKVMIKVLKLIEKPLGDDVDSVENSRGEFAEKDMVRNISRMRYLALEVLRNVLLSNQRDGSLIVINGDEKATTTQVLNILVKELEDAESSPHHALLAAECLGLLIDASPAAKDIAFKENVVPAINRSYATGKSCHALLESEAEKLRNRFTQLQMGYSSLSVNC